MQKIKNVLSLVEVLLTFSISFSQVNEKELLEKSAKAAEKAVDITNLGWKRGGTLTFLFNQSAFNKEWLSGGTSSISGNLGLNYDFNHKTRTSVWDNKIIAAYGLTKLGDAKTTKSDDRFEFHHFMVKKKDKVIGIIQLS